MKKPKPQLKWAFVDGGVISFVRICRESVLAEVIATFGNANIGRIRRVEVRVVARKRKRRKP